MGSGFGNSISSLFQAPRDFLSGKSCSTVCGPVWDAICYIENFCVFDLLKLAAILVLIYFALAYIYLSYKLGILNCICGCICSAIRSVFAACFNTSKCCFSLFLLRHLSNPTRRTTRHRLIRQHHNNNTAMETTASTTEQYNYNSSSHSSSSSAGRLEEAAVSSNSMTSRSRSGTRSSRRIRRHRHHYIRRSMLRPRSHRVELIGIRGSGAHRRKSTTNGRQQRSISLSGRYSCHNDRGGDDGLGIRVRRTSRFAKKSRRHKR